MGKYENKLENFNKAVVKLEEVCNMYDNKNEILRDSIVKRFEFTYELAWKTLKEYLVNDGIPMDIPSPRNVFKLSYQFNIIDDEQLWLNIIKDRNVSTHQYNEDKINELVEVIIKDYLNLFIKLKDRLNNI